MKNVFRWLLLGLATVLVASCENEDNVATPDGAAVLEFAMLDAPEPFEQNANAREANIPVPLCQEDLISSIFVQINNVGYELNPQFFPGLGTWQVQLPMTQPGIYEVQEVAFLDAQDEVIFATPEVGSAFAAFVNKPVPFKVEVKNGEKLINTAEALCFWPGKAPEFGIKILEVDRCYVFKNWYFFNWCDDYGHAKGYARGGILDPVTGKYFPGAYDDDYGFFYTLAKLCENDYYSYVYLYFCITDGQGNYRYYQIPVPVWLLKYYKYDVIHILSDCDYNYCRSVGAQTIAADLGIEGFDVGEWDGTEISQEEFEKVAGAEE